MSIDWRHCLAAFDAVDRAALIDCISRDFDIRVASLCHLAVILRRWPDVVGHETLKDSMGRPICRGWWAVVNGQPTFHRALWSSTDVRHVECILQVVAVWISHRIRTLYLPILFKQLIFYWSCLVILKLISCFHIRLMCMFNRTISGWNFNS